MSKARPLSLPPSGVSVWRPLSSSESGLVAILGSGPSEGSPSSDEDVQCVWCGLRSRPAAACDVCGSPLYETISIWQTASAMQVEEPPMAGKALFGWPARHRERAVDDSPPGPVPDPSWEPSPSEAPTGRDTALSAFKRFAGLEIRWICRAND